MTCLGCQACETHPVKLHNGTTVCTYCKEWLRECDARNMNKLKRDSPNKWALIERQIKEKRGEAAANELFEVMKELS